MSLSLLGLLGACIEDVSLCDSLAVEPRAPATAEGLVYEVYVRSFQDSDGDGVGDLEGVRARLDHVASLGATAIWLMPIHPSPSVAGYDTTDLGGVAAAYGTQEDLDRLVADAEKRGIRVLLDAPLNHTSRAHPWFEAALADPDASGRYLVSDTRWDAVRWHPTGEGRWFYGEADAGVLAFSREADGVRVLARVDLGGRGLWTGDGEGCARAVSEGPYGWEVRVAPCAGDDAR